MFGFLNMFRKTSASPEAIKLEEARALQARAEALYEEGALREKTRKELEGVNTRTRSVLKAIRDRGYDSQSLDRRFREEVLNQEALELELDLLMGVPEAPPEEGPCEDSEPFYIEIEEQE